MLTRFKFAFYHCEFRNLRFYALATVIGVLCAIMGVGAYKKYQLQEIQCLAMNIYHEARGEPLAGQQAVAVVTMNRVQAREFPDSVCEVVYQRRIRRSRFFGEFSWTQDEVTDIPMESPAWIEALSLARRVYFQYPEIEQLDGAVYYHAAFLTPYWAPVKIRVRRIGNHIFYR